MKKLDAQRIAKEFVEKSGFYQEPLHIKQLKDVNSFKKQLLNLTAPSSEELVYNAQLNKWFKKYNYTEIRRLGSGSFGSTSLVHDNNIDRNFVLKTIKLTTDNIKSIFQEIDMLKKIAKYGCKTNLLCYVDYYINYGDKTLYIVTDTFDNSKTLFDFIRYHQQNKIKIPTGDLLKIMKGLLQALVYLHKIGIAHADIKPENILINDNLDIQLIDFGISCAKDCSVKGTVLYQSPELLMITGKKVNNKELKKGDIFSMGVVFYLLANLSLPYPTKSTLYPLATMNTYDNSDNTHPVVSFDNPMSAIFSLVEYYRKIGGYLTKKEREVLETEGKTLPPNFIMSTYEYENATIDKKINVLIETMLDTNENTRPLAKHCMSLLNKILAIYNLKNNMQVISPGIISPSGPSN